MIIKRGSTDIKDRIFACLVYLIPLYSAVAFGSDLFAQFPVLDLIKIPLLPIGIIYGAIPFGGFLVFILLYAAVVRNERISHFIRFNTMQAILIDIVLSLLAILFFQIIGPGILPGLITNTIFNVIFTVVLAVCLYSIVESIRGGYAEIPTISQAVYNQVP